MTVIEVRGDAQAFQQRIDNLKKANEVRVFKARRKKALETAEDPYWIVVQMLREPEGPEGAFDARELIMSIPKIGVTKTKEMLKRADVRRDVRLRDMTPRERVCLSREVSELGQRRLGVRAAA